MKSVVLTRAATASDGGAEARDALVEANRLRRMDRFGRSGVRAGARVLSAAGRAMAAVLAEPDPRFGVVVGTACGCRDAITQHERLLASARRVEDLAPSVFVATVHNAVAGELAILYGLGGVAETLVSGRTAGLEALVLAARRVAGGDADRILVVAAEGVDDEMRAAWERENPGRTLVESAAAVLVEVEEEVSLRGRVRARLVDAELAFDGNPEAVASEGVERLGASGLWAIALDLEAARQAPAADAPHPHSPSEEIRNRRYIVRDVHGSCCAVTLDFSS